MFIYYIYDENNNLIFRGTRMEVCRKFGISPKSLYSYYGEGSKLNRKYKVVQGEWVKPPIKNVYSKEDKLIDYYTSHLNKYGNVYSKEDPNPYLNILKKLGYHCKIDEYQVIDDAEIIISEQAMLKRKRKRKYATDYVLTRIKDEV